MTTTSDRVTSTALPGRTARALAVAATVGAALVAWIVLVPLLGVQLTVDAGPGGGGASTVGPGAVLATSLLASLLAWGLLGVLEARTRRSRTIWTITAVVVLLVSMIGPLTGGDTTASKASLVVLHLSVAAALIPLLRRTTRTRRPL